MPSINFVGTSSNSKNSLKNANAYINEFCHTLIMSGLSKNMKMIIEKMKFWEIFESKKCFVLYNFRNRGKSRDPWCILNWLRVLATRSPTLHHVRLNWTVSFSDKSTIWNYVYIIELYCLLYKLYRLYTQSGWHMKSIAVVEIRKNVWFTAQSNVKYDSFFLN